MESKNLKGLFNLTRKEFKDVRKDIETLEKAVSFLTEVVNGLQGWEVGDRDEILGCLKRIENLLKERTEQADGFDRSSEVGKWGKRESALLRSLLRNPGNVEPAINALEDDAGTQDEQSTDRRSSTPEGRGISTPDDKQTLPEPEDLALTPRSHHSALAVPRSQKPLPTTDQEISLSTDNLHVCDPGVEKRLGEMSSQIEQLMEGQRQMMTVLKGMAERESKSARSPVVVPPPRKVGRKVVGFVYEDDDGDS